jgi:hypothetical protein
MTISPAAQSSRDELTDQERARPEVIACRVMAATKRELTAGQDNWSGGTSGASNPMTDA